jgi:polysaccharide pyruvyl transferase WcaK-like protein
VNSVEQLLEGIARCRLVVTARFHGVVHAYGRGRPAIALAYHHKVPELMAGMGQSEQCLVLEKTDGRTLTDAVRAVDQSYERTRRDLNREVATRRSILSAQFDRLFGMAQAPAGGHE